jgi:hypothetical protein
MTSTIQVTKAHYPESDGKPMGETDEHRHEMVQHIENVDPARWSSR